MSVILKPSPPKIAHSVTSKYSTFFHPQNGLIFAVHGNIIQTELPHCTIFFSHSRYIHPSHYHTRSPPLAQILIQEYDHHIYYLYLPVAGSKEIYESLLTKYPFMWETSFSNKIYQLAQVVGTSMKSGKENIFIITRNLVPNGQKIMYANPVCDYHPRKDDPYRVILTIGCDTLSYP